MTHLNYPKHDITIIQTDVFTWKTTWIIEWNKEIIARLIWARATIPSHLDCLIPHSCDLVGHAWRGVNDETQGVSSWQPNELGEQTLLLHFVEVFSDPVQI